MRARQQIENSVAPEEVLETLTRNLVNKLTHEPTVNLRSAIADGDTSLLDAVRTLFSLRNRK
jgi:glutamyl-tRNA reductase